MPPRLADNLKLPLSDNTKNIIMKAWDDILHIAETIWKWDKGRIPYVCIKQPAKHPLVRYSSLVSENPSVVVPLSQDYFNEDLSSYILINLPVYYGKLERPSALYSVHGAKGYFLTKEPSVALVCTSISSFESQYDKKIRQEICENINTITYADSTFLEVHYEKPYGSLLGGYDFPLDRAVFERLLEMKISITQDLLNYAYIAYNVRDMFDKYWFERKYAKYGRFSVRLYYCFVPEKEKFYQTFEFTLRTNTDDPTRMISTSPFYVLFDQEDITKMRQDYKINRIFESLEDYAMQNVLQSILPEHYHL